MSVSKLYFLLLVVVSIVLGVSLVVVNTSGLSYSKEASVQQPAMMMATQSSPTSQPTQPVADNTGLWVALISSLTLNLFALVGGMFNAWLSFRLKMALKDAQASIDENTTITKQTKAVVKEQSVTVDQIKKDIDESNH